MNKNLIPFLLVGNALLTGCNQQQPATDTPATAAPVAVAPVAANVSKADAVAIVNGIPISKTTFKTLEDEIARRTHGQKFPKQQLLEELIQGELLVQDAQKKHLDQSTEVKNRIDMVTRTILAQADSEDYRKTHAINEAEIKAVYDKEVVAKASGTEYKARHILVKTENEAKKLIAELTKGAKFEELAKKHSLDPSKDQGGDLGWFTEGQMVEPFSKAVAGLEKGKFTLIPIQTQFGWHVILREDSRPQIPPPFNDELKEQIRHFLENQQTPKMIEELRKNAKVETLMSFEEPKPEVPAPAAASVPTDGTAATPPAAIESNPQPVDASKPAEPAAKTDSAVPAGDRATAGSTDAAKSSEAPAEAAKTESAVAPADKAGTESSAKPVEPAKK